MPWIFITIVTTIIVTITQPVWLNTDICLLTLEMIYRARCVSRAAIMSLIWSHIILTVIDAIADLKVCRQIRHVSLLQNWDINWPSASRVCLLLNPMKPKSVTLAFPNKTTLIKPCLYHRKISYAQSSPCLYSTEMRESFLVLHLKEAYCTCFW